MAPRLLLALFVASQARALEKCTLSGTVVNSVTGQPLSKTLLRLDPLAGRDNHSATTTSDAAGRFTMEELGPGRYRLVGFRNGYLGTSFGVGLSNTAGGIVLDLLPGESLKDVKLKLVPFAAIAGTVHDMDGEPLANVAVEILHKSYRRGAAGSLDMAGRASTDDLGQYRIHDLPAGKYYVGAAQSSADFLLTSSVDHSPAKAGPPETNLRTFYPGVQDPGLAMPIEVAAGAQRSGIDITLGRSRTYRVTGRVINNSGANLGSIEVTIGSRHGGFSMLDPRLSTDARVGSGDFELHGLPPGSYMLFAGSRDRKYETGVPIEVMGSDITDVRLVIGPGADVKGQVTVEGRQKPGVDASVMVNNGRNLQHADVGSDGAFTLRTLPFGHYAIFMSDSIKGKFYVKSMQLGDVDVLSDGLQVSQAGPPPLEIVLGADGGSANGAVLDKDEHPVTGATVVLVPEPKLRARIDLYRTATTDQHGAFEFKAIAPGDYQIFAWDDVEADAWFDPDVLKDFEKQGQSVAISPNAHELVSVHVIAPAGLAP